jgi:hypothetical protein
MRIHRMTRLCGAVLALLLLAPACGTGRGGSGGSGGGGPGGGSGGSGVGPGASGVDGSKRVVDLSDAEKGQLCDWMVARAGSYGNPGTCDRNQPPATYPFLAFDDQAACIADLPDPSAGCQATVGELEACVSLLPACASLIDVSSRPACAFLASC